MQPTRLAARLVLLLAVAAVSAAQAPPPEVTSRLEGAFQALEPSRFAGSYTLKERTVVSKLDGDDREENVEVRRTTCQPGTPPQVELLSAEANGQDVTATRRKKAARDEQRQAHRRGDDGGEHDEVGASLRLPMGDDLRFYEFGQAVDEGSLTVIPFAPRAEHRTCDGLARGRLAWDPDTLEPAWVEAELVSLPRGAKQLSMHFELGRQGDLLYLARIVTNGVGGLLWIKRRVHAEMEFSDVEPAPAQPPGP